MPISLVSSSALKRSALFLSPHLDDVAFSCGGTLLRLVEEGCEVCLCTIFTASVRNPQGFALACQLDKGLSADVDYMALRRDEDRVFAAKAKVNECIHLNAYEAPHRNYVSAADLFAGVHPQDEVGRGLVAQIRKLAAGKDLIFAPQGLGNHVDHLQTILILREAGLTDRAVWYSDTPYAIRKPGATPASLLPHGLFKIRVPIDLQRKVKACEAYKTQVPFQFGSDRDMYSKLEQFHSSNGGYSESLLCNMAANVSPSQSRTITLGI